MTDDVLSMAWCRQVYHDPTSTRAQVAAAWAIATVLVSERLRANPWQPTPYSGVQPDPV